MGASPALARLLAWLALLLLAHGCGGVGPGPLPPPAPMDPTPLAADDDAREVARLVAVARGRPLPRNDRLNRAARHAADDMHARGYFAHTSPEGQTPLERARLAGWPGPVGEVLAAGYRTPREAVAGWMNSPGHRSVLTHRDAVALGSGRAGSLRVVVVGLRNPTRGLAPDEVAPDLTPPGILDRSASRDMASHP